MIVLFGMAILFNLVKNTNSKTYDTSGMFVYQAGRTGTPKVNVALSTPSRIHPSHVILPRD